MRQHRELRRQSQVGKRRGDVGFPGARAHQSRAEAIRLPELEADVINGGAQTFRSAFSAPQILDALIVRRKWRAGCNCVRDTFERRAVTIARRVPELLAL